MNARLHSCEAASGVAEAVGLADAPMPWRDPRGPVFERRAPGPQQIVQGTWTVVLAGGRGTRLGPLTDRRAKPAVPFGGSLRIVDFALGNAINSGLRRISVMTQYRAQGLIRHVSQGWRDAAAGAFIDAVPAQQKTGEGWYAGTADAVHQNLDLLEESGARWVLVLAGDHVCRLDLRPMLVAHARSGAGVTVGCVEVPHAEACAFGVMRTDASRRVLAFDEKPARPAPLPGRDDASLVSTGLYVFDAALLTETLRRDAADMRSTHDFGRDLLPRLVAAGLVRAHPLADGAIDVCAGEPYWRDVGTLDAYWAAHRDLLRPVPPLDLHDTAWPIRGAPRALPPARFASSAGRRGRATDALVAAGCVIDGASVRRSVLSTEVRVGARSVVEDAVVMPGAVVGRDVVLRRAIVDEGCVLPDGLRIGVDPGHDRERFHVSDGGVVVVTGARLAALRDPRGVASPSVRDAAEPQPA
ncbi:MAG: glucose-1-phosphate adenylyltransferase [Burkholderiaceae bacterium]|nr:glucose-1-phosphate adenylyltransferase [Burkholderiaceae bacterium]